MKEKEKRVLIGWVNEEKDFLFRIKKEIDLHEKKLDERVAAFFRRKR